MVGERQLESGSATTAASLTAPIVSVWLLTGILAGVLSLDHRGRLPHPVFGGVLAGAITWLSAPVYVITLMLVDPQFRGVDWIATFPMIFGSWFPDSLPFLTAQLVCVVGGAAGAGVLLGRCRRRT